MRTARWIMPLLLLLLVPLPLLVAPRDARAIPGGLALYAIGLAAWWLSQRAEADRLRSTLIGALMGLAAAYLAMPLLRFLAYPPLEFGDSAAGHTLLVLALYLGLGLLGAGWGARVGAVSAAEGIPRDVSSAPPPLRKICDTSVLIDGRIADMAEAGFVDGTLIIPQFILRELQSIADSAEPLKRNRGRRGLDVVKRLQEIEDVTVEITAADYPDEREVDHKLLRLATDLEASLITNDFNLNKVARVRSIKVLNLNDLVNALKTIFLPGEVIQTTVTRSGKEPGQGIAYLDDGTMVVVDGGAAHVGRQVRTVVTNIHQTTAGRMIFSRFEDVAGRKSEAEDKQS